MILSRFRFFVKGKVGKEATENFEKKLLKIIFSLNSVAKDYYALSKRTHIRRFIYVTLPPVIIAPQRS